MDLFGYASSENQLDGGYTNFLLIDRRKVDMKNEKEIAKELAKTIYYNEGEDVKETEARTLKIKDTIEFINFKDQFRDDNLFMKYEYEGDTKYIMFDNIQLLRTRLDNSEVRDSPNKAGVIISSDVFNAEIEDKKERIRSQIIIVNSIVIA